MNKESLEISQNDCHNKNNIFEDKMHNFNIKTDTNGNENAYKKFNLQVNVDN